MIKKPAILNNVDQELWDSCARFAKYTPTQRKKRAANIDVEYYSRLRDAFYNLYGEDLLKLQPEYEYKDLPWETWREIVAWVMFLEKKLQDFHMMEHSQLRAEIEMKPNGKAIHNHLS